MATASADLQDVWDTASVVAYGQFSHTFWIVELDDFEPLGIWAHTESPDTDAWLAEIAPLIDGATFGEPGPAASGGTARLSTFVSGADGSGDEASPLPSTGATMEAGTYTTSSLGLPITFDIVDDASWRVSLRNALAFAIETDRGFVAMQRMGSFYDAEQAQSPSVTGLGSIPPDDFDGWIEANGVTVDRSEQVTVDGRPADLRVVRAPEGSGADLCPAEAQPCIRLNSVSADAIEANPNDGSRIDGPNPNAYWMIELDDFEPLGIWAYAVDGDIDAWLDEIAPIIASIALGDPGPAVEGGTARVPLRVTVSAPFSGVRTNGEQLDDGSTAIGYEATSEGPAAGEITGTGWAIPGAPTVGHDENVFTGSIDGVGTGTLSWTVDWTGTNPTDPVSRGIVTGGTGDFAGVTGTVTPDLDSSDQSGGVDAVTGTNTFELVIPRSG
jgi:hypothetical protein